MGLLGASFVVGLGVLVGFCPGVSWGILGDHGSLVSLVFQRGALLNGEPMGFVATRLLYYCTEYLTADYRCNQQASLTSSR